MSLKPKTIAMIEVVAKALGELNENAIFVGGATVPFYLPEVYWPQARFTEDIDVVMEIVGRTKAAMNDEILRAKGSRHDSSEGAPICRWVYEGTKVDIMSSDKSALGFTNCWYKEGIEKSIEVITKPVSIKTFSLPYFIATKLEAFQSRGNFDYQRSSDMEDIISVLEVSPKYMLEDIFDECTPELRKYLSKELGKLLDTAAFLDALPGAVFNRTAVADSVFAIKNRIKAIASR